jgi:hypothetical protein
MKTKEKLERSGWVFKHSLDYGYEIYGRGNLRVILDKRSNTAVAVYNIFEADFRLIDDFLFEFLTEKIEAE